MENQQPQAVQLEFTEARNALQNTFSEVVGGQAIQIAMLNKQIEIHLQAIQDIENELRLLKSENFEIQQVVEMQRAQIEGMTEKTGELSPELAEIAGAGSVIARGK